MKYRNSKTPIKFKQTIPLGIGSILGEFTLGSISSMLSIGGGPINVCVFALLFSMDTKESSVNSIIVILLSQLSKLTFIILKGALPPLDLTVLLPMIMGGILGGVFGSTLNNKLDNKNISLIFNTCLIFLIFLNGFNIYKIQF
ncbi:MAG: TSUP family transporter [Sarcina sp.]